MRAIEVRVKVGEEKEPWILPLSRLTRVRQIRVSVLGEGGILYLHFDGGLLLAALDPDGALLDEVRRALEASNGIYAIGGLWEYKWVRSATAQQEARDEGA